MFEIYMMDNQMLEAINYIRNVSKKKVTIDRVVTYLNNAGAFIYTFILKNNKNVFTSHI